MYTIPMKARKSKRSRLQSSGDDGLAPSLRVMKRRNKWDDRRYMLSIGLFAFATAGLIFGTVGGVIQDANARSGQYGGYYYRNNTTYRSNQDRYSNNQSNTSQSQQKKTTNTNNTQQQTVKSQTAPAPSSTTPQQQQSTPKATTVKRTQTAPAAQVEQKPVDTSKDIATATSAQAASITKPITYTSHQISTETRDRLLAVAGAAGAVASMIFILSLMGASGSTPTRIRIPVREVVTS